MPKRNRPFGKRGVPAAIGAALLVHWATPALAQGQSNEAPVSVSHQLNYIATQRNPWAAGASLEQGDEAMIGLPRINQSLPTTGFNPYQALANLFGISLPEIGFAEMGGYIRGEAVLKLGYRVSGGRLDISYPAEVELTMQRADPVRTDVEVIVETRFSPGLRRLGVMSNRPTCPGEDPRFIPCGLSETVLRTFEISVEPRFSTTFPTASAYARFEYDLDAGAFVAAGVARAGSLCFVCYRRSYRFPRRGQHDLVRVSPSGIEIAGLDPIRLFDQTIPVGPGSITVSYPRLEARNLRRGPDGLSLIAEDTQPLIEFSGAIDKLFPFIGPFLTNDIGPIGYSILGMSAGPRLSLYQNFRLEVAPRVTLHFSRPVMHRVGDRYNQTAVIGPVPIGQQIRWRPVGLDSGPIDVQPVYDLGARFFNQTGLALGYRIDFGGLRVTAGGFEVGPVPLGTVSDDRLATSGPFCCAGGFDVDFDPIRPAPIRLQVQVGRTEFDRNAAIPTPQQTPERDAPGSGRVAGSIGDRLSQGLGDRRPRLPELANRPGRLSEAEPTPAAPQGIQPRDLESRQSIARLLPLSPYLQDRQGGRLYISVARRSLEAVGCQLAERRCRELFGPGLRSTPLQTEVLGGDLTDISTTDVDPRTPRARNAPGSRAD